MSKEIEGYIYRERGMRIYIYREREGGRGRVLIVLMVMQFKKQNKSWNYF